MVAEPREGANGLEVAPWGGSLDVAYELGGSSPARGEADTASVGVGWLVGDWLSSKLGRGIWVPPGEDGFMPSGWAG